MLMTTLVTKARPGAQGRQVYECPAGSQKQKHALVRLDAAEFKSLGIRQILVIGGQKRAKLGFQSMEGLVGVGYLCWQPSAKSLPSLMRS